MQTIQIHFSAQQQKFSPLFVTFFKSTSNFEHIKKKHDRHRLCISEITDPETRAYKNV